MQWEPFFRVNMEGNWRMSFEKKGEVPALDNGGAENFSVKKIDENLSGYQRDTTTRKTLVVCMQPGQVHTKKEGWDSPAEG